MLREYIKNRVARQRVNDEMMQGYAAALAASGGMIGGIAEASGARRLGIRSRP
ncbi:hypothetical protein [Bradyrhizobium sp. SEMIA]|uniref:hypothetical protein n=1 Tax=Bradyrhizobium sp. SEMIA TaxID=2597515 RepID=UPI00223EDCC5|nr:hypothetical protein [Bradyrhizobium sp. SEMIA]